MASVPLPPRPRQVPQTAAPSRLLTSWVLLFYLLLEKNSLSLWVCCGSNKLPCFSQFWNATKSNRVGRWLLPGKGATSLERNGGEKQLNLCTGPTAVCAPWESHTLSPRLQVHTQTHTFTYTSVNPTEVQRWLSAPLLHTSTFKLSGKGVLEMTDGWGSYRMPQSLTTGSGRHWYTRLRQESRSRHWDSWLTRSSRTHLVVGEYEFGTLLCWEHPMLGVYMHNVHLFAHFGQQLTCWLG